MDDANDFYGVLNISKQATPVQIRQAYKTLVRKWHPDKHPPSSKDEAETKFKSITQAYGALNGEDYRTMFGAYSNVTGWSDSGKVDRDRQKQRSKTTDKAGTPLPRTGSSIRNHTRYNQPAPTSRSFPGSTPGPTMFSRRRKPPAIELRLECTLEELFHGCKKEVRFTRSVVVGKNGEACNWKREEVKKVRVKPGWKKGTKVTFEGGGGGDVTFVIAEKEHPRFKRSGNDLVLKVEVPLVNALTGWSFTYRLLGGERRSYSTSEDEIISPGYVKIVEGEGMPIGDKDRAGGGDLVRGDLRIKFLIVFPVRLSLEQRCQIKNVLRDSSSA